MDFFRRWLGTADWQRIGMISLGVLVLCMLPLAFWILRPDLRPSAPELKAWRRLNRRLARLQLQAGAGEGPRAWQQRLRQALPRQQAELDAFFDAWVRLRYAGSDQAGRATELARMKHGLKRLIKALPRRRPPRPTRLAGLPDGEQQG